MNSRQERILKAIVEVFLKSANPVGSRYLFEEYNFDVSPATIRNDMASLEEEGLIYQPHTSAGRIPTGIAYRNFVNALAVNKGVVHQAQVDIQKAYKERQLKKLKEKLYDLVAILAEVTNSISFTTVPGKKRVFYIGISRVMLEPEFTSSPETTSRVVEILENELYELLEELNIDDEVTVSIGKENILPAMHSCSLIATRYNNADYEGVMGILGPTRMNYAYNIAALKQIVRML